MSYFKTLFFLQERQRRLSRSQIPTNRPSSDGTRTPTFRKDAAKEWAPANSQGIDKESAQKLPPVKNGKHVFKLKRTAF